MGELVDPTNSRLPCVWCAKALGGFPRGGTSLSDGTMFIARCLRYPQKGVEGTWEFLHGAPDKPPSNLDLILYPAAMWANW